MAPLPPPSSSLFFFNDTATTEIYTLSLHDALPISCSRAASANTFMRARAAISATWAGGSRSEEHTSELQSRRDLVCRLLLEKKKKKKERKRARSSRGGGSSVLGSITGGRAGGSLVR